MITNFKLYEGLNINLRLITSLFPVLYRRATKNIVDLHQSLTEDHLLEFINHYLFNNYGIDLTNSSDAYKYVKYLVHKNFIKKNKVSESKITGYSFSPSGTTVTKYNINSTPTVNSKELFGAVRNLNLTKIKSLLKQHADPNVRTSIGKTPMMNAISIVNGYAPKVIKVVELLYKYGANLNAQDNSKMTSLMYAANPRYRVYNYIVIDKLIELGADWNLKDEDDYDFISILMLNEDDNKIKELKEKYPNKFERYMIRKENDKYNL